MSISGVSFFVSQRYYPNNTNINGKSATTLSHSFHYIHIYSYRLPMFRKKLAILDWFQKVGERNIPPNLMFMGPCIVIYFYSKTN